MVFQTFLLSTVKVIQFFDKRIMTTTGLSSEIYENFKLNNQEKASKNLLKEIWLEITKNEVRYEL